MRWRSRTGALYFNTTGWWGYIPAGRRQGKHLDGLRPGKNETADTGETAKIPGWPGLPNFPVHLMRELDKKTSFVLLWPRQLLTVKEVILPPVPPGRLKAMLRYEMEGQLPFPPTESFIAGYRSTPLSPSSSGSRQVRVLSFCARAKQVESVVEALVGAGLRISGVVPATMALLRSLPRQSGYYLHATIYKGDTEVLLMHDGRLLRSVWIGETAVPAICSQLQLWWKGMAHEFTDMPVDLGVSGELAEEVRRELAGTDLFAAVHATPDAAGVSARSRMLKVGVAAAVWPEGAELELSPPALQLERREAHNRHRQVLAGVGMAFVLALLAGYGYTNMKQLEAKRSSLAAAWQEVAPAVEAAEAARRERDGLLRAVEAWHDELAKRPDWLKLLAELAESLPEGVWLTELRAETGKPYQISGQATSADAAMLFMQQLQDTTAWAGAKLELTKMPPGSAGAATFVISGTWP